MNKKSQFIILPIHKIGLETKNPRWIFFILAFFESPIHVDSKGVCLNAAHLFFAKILKWHAVAGAKNSAEQNLATLVKFCNLNLPVGIIIHSYDLPNFKSQSRVCTVNRKVNPEKGLFVHSLTK